jgi:hypothetical protein
MVSEMSSQEVLVIVAGPTGPAVSLNQNEVLLSASVDSLQAPAELKPLVLKIS